MTVSHSDGVTCQCRVTVYHDCHCHCSPRVTVDSPVTRTESRRRCLSRARRRTRRSTTSGHASHDHNALKPSYHWVLDPGQPSPAPAGCRLQPVSLRPRPRPGPASGPTRNRHLPLGVSSKSASYITILDPEPSSRPLAVTDSKQTVMVTGGHAAGPMSYGPDRPSHGDSE